MRYSTQLYVELFKRGVFDPLVTVNGKKHTKQEQALQILTDKTTKDFGFGGAAGGAKSWTGVTWVTMMCLCYPETRYYIGREELKRLRESTLMTFFKFCSLHGIERDKDWKYNGQDHYIEFKNKSRIDMLDLKFLPSDPLYERYGSVEYTSGWIEEGSEVNFTAYDVLKTRVGRCNNQKYDILSKTFTTLNPKKNWCHTVYWKPFKENKLPDDRRFLQSFVQDNPFISPDYITNLENITDKITKQRLLFGNFDYSDEDGSLVSYDKIMDMFTNKFVPDDGQNYITIDLAITNDKFVCYAWKGLRVKEIRSVGNASKPVSTLSDTGEWINKVDFSPLVNTINELEVKWKVPRSNVAYDADGGMGEKMSHLIPGAIGIHNGHASIRVGYKNLSTELGYKLAEIINEDKMYYDCYLDNQLKETIKDEIQTSLKRSSEIGDKLALISKADVKSLIGHSPDHYDAKKYRMLFLLTRGN